MSMLFVALAVLGAVALYWPTPISLASQWSLGNYRHGWLVAAIVIGLLIRARRELAATKLRPNMPAAAAMFLASVAWAVLYKANLQAAHQFLWPLLVLLAVAAFAGRPAARTAAFPIAFLYFAVPIWNVLIPVLQLIAANVCGALLRASGIAAFIEGDLIQVAAGDFQVADGCSGLNFLVIALALSTLYGELLRAGWRARLKLMALAAALALVGNWLRIYSIVVIGVGTDMKSSLIDAHATFGWWIFAGVLLIFFLLAGRMRLSAPPVPAEDEAVNPGGARAPAVTLGVIGFLAGPALLVLPHSPPPGTQWITLQPNPDGFSGPAALSSNWRPRFDGASATVAAVYRLTGDSTANDVEVYVARYAIQREGAEIASESNSILGGLERYAIVGTNAVAGTRSVGELVIEIEGREAWVVWYGYAVGDREFVSRYAEALWYGVASLHSDPASSVFAARSRCRNDCAEARALLARFWPTGWEK